MISSILVALLFILIPGQKEAEAKLHAFRWLSASGETAGIRLDTHKLEIISVSQQAPASEAETETVPLENGGTLTTARVYNVDANGSRVLTETVVEEVRNFPGGRTEALRTISRREINGRMPMIGKYTQETVLSGSNSYQTKMTVEVAGVHGGALAPVEQEMQIEHSKGPNEIEIDRTQLAPGADGGWVAKGRRSSNTQIGADQLSTEEAVYGSDANGNLRLTVRVASREWKDASGNERRELSTYRSDLAGHLNLGNRIQISRTNLVGGDQQTTQTVNGVNPVAPSDDMRIIEKFVETIRSSGPQATERSLTVLNPDLNGQDQAVNTLRTIQIK
jgi:hypothetical protein